jgi:hypothetical protein
MRAFKMLSDAAHSLDTQITSLTRGSWFHGWRMGVCLVDSCFFFLVLSYNIAIIGAGAASKAGYNPQGILDLIIGDEETVSW